MLSFFSDTKKTTLIFPNSQLLWAFFSIAELSEFRIDSSKFAFTGKLQINDIEIAKQRLGANEPGEANSVLKNNKRPAVLNFTQLITATCNSLITAFVFAILYK